MYAYVLCVRALTTSVQKYLEKIWKIFRNCVDYTVEIDDTIYIRDRKRQPTERVEQ